VGWTTLFMEDMGDGNLHKKEGKKICSWALQQDKLAD
jgi:hypothetical protein